MHTYVGPFWFKPQRVMLGFLKWIFDRHLYSPFLKIYFKNIPSSLSARISRRHLHLHFLTRPDQPAAAERIETTKLNRKRKKILLQCLTTSLSCRDGILQSILQLPSGISRLLPASGGFVCRQGLPYQGRKRKIQSAIEN